MDKIAVITPTIRPEGLAIVQKALEEQDFESFDWYVCSPFDPHSWATWIPDNFKGGIWSLNRAYQELIRQAKCDLIVSWQDWTYAKPDTLSKFWKHYEYEPKMLVSALGDKYEDDSWKVKTWVDPRKGGLCGAGNVEWNLCSCPRQSLVDIGGFDTEADFLYMGCDGFQVNQRLEQNGNTFYVDPKIESFSLGHGRVPDWDKKNGIDNGTWIPYKKRVIELKNTKRWPVIGKL